MGTRPNRGRRTADSTRSGISSSARRACPASDLNSLDTSSLAATAAYLRSTAAKSAFVQFGMLMTASATGCLQRVSDWSEPRAPLRSADNCSSRTVTRRSLLWNRWSSASSAVADSRVFCQVVGRRDATTRGATTETCVHRNDRSAVPPTSDTVWRTRRSRRRSGVRHVRSPRAGSRRRCSGRSFCARTRYVTVTPSGSPVAGIIRSDQSSRVSAGTGRLT
jgi:hypothetical protein